MSKNILSIAVLLVVSVCYYNEVNGMVIRIEISDLFLRQSKCTGTQQTNEPLKITVKHNNVQLSNELEKPQEETTKLSNQINKTEIINTPSVLPWRLLPEKTTKLGNPLPSSVTEENYYPTSEIYTTSTEDYDFKEWITATEISVPDKTTEVVKANLDSVDWNSVDLRTIDWKSFNWRGNSNDEKAKSSNQIKTTETINTPSVLPWRLLPEETTTQHNPLPTSVTEENYYPNPEIYTTSTKDYDFEEYIYTTEISVPDKTTEMVNEEDWHSIDLTEISEEVDTTNYEGNLFNLLNSPQFLTQTTERETENPTTEENVSLSSESLVLGENSNDEKTKLLPSYGWVDSNIDTPLPKNAVKCCTDEEGHDVYIGQTAYENYLVGVKIIPALKKAYAAYLGDEVDVKEYMVLVNFSPAKPVWIKSKSGGNTPTDAVYYGYNPLGLKLYVARARHNGIWIPGYYVAGHDVIYYPYAGREEYGFDFEVLVNRAEV